jgi:DNA-binding transcriptional regulator YdaS (Cro superfamily)
VSKKKKKKRGGWSWRQPADCEPGLRRAIKAAGSITNLSLLLRITTQAIAQWDRIPLSRVIQVERVTGVDRTKLRPDLFRR